MPALLTLLVLVEHFGGMESRAQAPLSIDELAELSAERGPLPLEAWWRIEEHHAAWWKEIAAPLAERMTLLHLSPDRPSLDPVALEQLHLRSELIQECERAEAAWFLTLADAMPEYRERVESLARARACRRRLPGALLDGLRPPGLRSILARATLAPAERDALDAELATIESSMLRDSDALAWRLNERRRLFGQSMEPADIARLRSDPVLLVAALARWDADTSAFVTTNLEAAQRRLAEIHHIVAASPEHLRVHILRRALESFALRSPLDEVTALEQSFERGLRVLPPGDPRVEAGVDLRAAWRDEDAAILCSAIDEALPIAALLPLDQSRSDDPEGVRERIEEAWLCRTERARDALAQWRSVLAAQASMIDRQSSNVLPLSEPLREHGPAVPALRWQPLKVRGTAGPSLPRSRLFCDPGPLDGDEARALLFLARFSADAKEMAVAFLTAHGSKASMRILGGPSPDGVLAPSQPTPGAFTAARRAAIAEASREQSRWLAEVERTAFSMMAALAADEPARRGLQLAERVRALERSLAPIRTLVEGEPDQRHASNLPSVLVRIMGTLNELRDNEAFMAALEEESATLAEIAARRALRAEPIAAEIGRREVAGVDPARRSDSARPRLADDARAAIAAWWKEDDSDRRAMNEATDRLLDRVAPLVDRPQGIPLRTRWLAVVGPSEFGSRANIFDVLTTLRSRAALTRDPALPDLDALRAWIDTQRDSHRREVFRAWDTTGLECLLEEDAWTRARSARAALAEAERALLERARRAILVVAPALVARGEA